jgi:hypothetical protein
MPEQDKQAHEATPPEILPESTNDQPLEGVEPEALPLVCLDRVGITLELDPQVNYALQQNDVPVIKALSLENLGQEVTENLRVSLRVEPGPSRSGEERVGRIEPGASYNLRPKFELPPGRLLDLTERERCELVVEVWDSEERLLGRAREPVTLLAYNEWGGTRSLSEALAAFVLPNHPALAPVLRRAGELLGEETGDPSLSGYQSRDPLRVLAMAGAIYRAIQERDITYINPPASFESQGQKILLPDQVLGDRLATCLDISVLYAACLERAGLRPLLVLIEGHALAGFWLQESGFPQVTVEGEAAILRKRCRLEEAQVVEITAVTARPSLDFLSSMDAGMERLENPGESFFAVDVHQARIQQIRPLPVRARGPGGELLEANPGEAKVPVVSRTSSLSESLPGSEGEGHGVVGSEAKGSRLDRWKSRLLDLTYRNRLLSYRPSKRSLELLVPSVGLMEDALVAGKVFKLEALKDASRNAVRDPEAIQSRTGEDLRQVEVEKLFGRGVLPAERTPEALETSLTEIFRSYRRGLEESGANTLYLSMGMLHFYEAPSSQTCRRAPVLLLPVEVERLKGGRGFRLKRTDEDGRINLTLLEKLRTDFRIEIDGLDPLPEDESGLDVPLIFKRVREAIKEKARWEVREEVHLATFSFTKFLMWKDLEDRAAALLESKVVRHLVETPNQDFDPEGSFPGLRSLDTERRPVDTLCPMDADSSQLRAVFSAMDGRSFVLVGPPGTGKSQTITNMISQALAGGKTVLFVAEKRAALEVVYKRLSLVGLAPFCLELHSNKVQKRHVLEQFRLALDASGWKPPRGWEEGAERLEKQRNELGEVVEALHRRRDLGVSVYQATSRSLALEKIPRVKLGSALEGVFDEAILEDWRQRVQQLQDGAEDVGDPRNHPWRAAGLKLWTPRHHSRIEDQLERLQGALELLEEGLEKVVPELGLTLEDHPRSEQVALVRLVTLVASPPDPTPSLLNPEGWEDREAALRGWVEQGLRAHTLRNILEVRYQVEELLKLDLPRLHGKYQTWSGAFFLLRFLFLFFAARELAGATREGEGAGAEEVLRELGSALEVRELEARLGAAREELGELLGTSEVGPLDWEELSDQLEWAAEVRRLVTEVGAEDTSALFARIRELVLEEGIPGFSTGALQVQEAWGELEAARSELAELLEAIPGDLFQDWDQGLFGEGLRDWLGVREEALGELENWCAFVEARFGVQEAGLEGLVEALESGSLAGGQLTAALHKAVYRRWLEAVMEGDDLLRRFRGESQQRHIERFQELDREHIRLSAQVVASRLAGKVPRGESSSKTSELGILRRELQKKRRHKPIRRLLEEIPHLLPRLCPCLLMSPLSVAQYLDPSTAPFDLVIFDEASQIPVWDAIGSLARGEKCVVVGDPKQLPPTSFFQSSGNEADEDEEEDAVEDLESILDECLAASLPRVTLDWHYRSRHESLIAFSNHRYYERRLLTFPSASEAVEGLGVSLHPVPDGFYDAKAGRINRAEAEAVVAEIVKRLQDPSQRDRSIGVVTFSASQQTFIEGLLDKARRKFPEIEPYFSDEVEEPVFVKNLENVQGDERCVMFFSICYGPDREGRVFMRFGPLNREGGERRLNVAITRAREELVVFSTLRADQIDLSRVRWPGVGDLKVFLDYAARGPRAIAEAVSLAQDAEAESPFEALVGDFLVSHGWVIHPQVGCSGYRIDLGVVHPDFPGRYLAGIECDGASYHSAATARDRDRLRQQVLEGLGWTMLRIWSTDWWKHRKREEKRILKALEEILAARRKLDQAEAGTDRNPAPISMQDSEPDESRKEPDEKDPDEKAGLARPYVPWRLVEDPPAKDRFLAKESMGKLAEQVQAVVATEGPIYLGLLLQRLLPVWGVKRSSKKIVAHLEKVVALLVNKNSLRQEEDLLWPGDQDPAAYEGYRLPGEDPASERKAEFLPDVEVANALEELLAREVSLEKDELLKVLARRLGYARLGTRVRAKMEAGLELAAGRGRLHIREDIAVWAGGSVPTAPS